MKTLIIALVGLQAVDGITTVWGVQHNIVLELNPFANSMVKTWWNIPIKIIPTLLVCLLMVWLIKKYSRLRKPFTIGLVCFVAFMGLVVLNGFIQVVLHYTV